MRLSMQTVIVNHLLQQVLPHLGTGHSITGLHFHTNGHLRGSVLHSLRQLGLCLDDVVVVAMRAVLKRREMVKKRVRER